MKRAVLVFAVLAVILSVPAAVSAQTVINPTKVEYDPSTDHAQLTKYVLGFYLVGATNPVQTVDLPIVAPDPGTGKIAQTMPFSSLAFGTYVARLQPCAGAACGEWSDPSNEGVRAPLAPAVPPSLKR